MPCIKCRGNDTDEGPSEGRSSDPNDQHDNPFEEPDSLAMTMHQSLICARLGAAILAGQEELIPLFITVPKVMHK
ncbi:hypothetical protein [Bacillus sp. N35-10-4]|uniref:hypothetical protein n=1 Tax=Bacillus sp. N35-10-4 TaxID=1866315 RepID=UPI0008FDC879|nr:hypothetical protein [Bacillus sp. N35-10-4]